MDNNEEKDLQLEENVPAKKQSFFSRKINAYKAKRKAKFESIQNQKLSDEEEKKVEEKLEEANKEVSKSKSGEKKKRIRSIIFFIFNIVLVVAILLWNIYTTDDFSPLYFAGIDFFYIFACLLMLLAIQILDITSVHHMIYKKTMRSRWALSFKSMATSRYYDAITPLASGGQAFMATYLTSRDVPASTALSIPIAKLVFQNITWVIIAGTCLVLSLTNGMSAFVSTTSIIGFILAILMIAAILFVSLSKKLGKGLVAWGLKLCVKMRIIKDYEKSYAKVMGVVEDYQNIMKEYSRSKFEIVFQIVLHALRTVCLYTIPYFIYLSFPYAHNANFIGNYGDFFIYTALIELAASFIPLPGGTGMNEITFTLLFQQYLGGATFWALIVWRFCSYYYYLLQGIGIISYDTIYGNRKYKWVKKRLQLRAESQEFRRTQIENFRQERTRRRKKTKKLEVKE